MAKNTTPVPIEHIERRIFLLRGKKVMLDFHLAEIYGVQTKILNKAVARNRHRFPEDFLFQLTSDEWNSLRFQIGTSKIIQHDSEIQNLFDAIRQLMQHPEKPKRQIGFQIKEPNVKYKTMRKK